MSNEENKDSCYESFSTTSIVCIVLSLLFAVFMFRYELGLKKPNYKPGDCVVNESRGEFDTFFSSYVILKVGKKEYLTLTYYPDTKTYATSTNGRSISYIDGYYEKSDICPSFSIVEE